MLLIAVFTLWDFPWIGPGSSVVSGLNDPSRSGWTLREFSRRLDERNNLSRAGIRGGSTSVAGSMPGHSEATVYLGNLDERVDERLLYEIMVQAGPLVEVYIPRDKETNRHKGYAFAEFTSEKSAQYALSLFSGLLSLYKRSVRLAIAGTDRPAAQAQAP